MNNLIGPLIGLVGGLLAALIVARHQATNTKLLIASELEKISKQNNLERQTAFRSRKEQWLLDVAPELLAACDPQLHADFDYGEVTSFIHRVQIILDPNNPLEAAVNESAGRIGMAVQDAITERRSTTKLLSAQDKFTMAVRAYLHDS